MLLPCQKTGLINTEGVKNWRHADRYVNGTLCSRMILFNSGCLAMMLSAMKVEPESYVLLTKF